MAALRRSTRAGAPLVKGNTAMKLSIPDNFAPLRDSTFLHEPSALPVRPRRDESNTHGAARMAEEYELQPWVAPERVAPHTTTWDYCYPIVENWASDSRGAESVLWAKRWHIPEEIRNQHMLVVSQPGGGKTQNFILPTLASDIADTERSVVVLDTKGDLLPFLQNLMDRYRPGQSIRVLNFADASRSMGWNPMHAVVRETRARRGDLSSALHELSSAVCWASEVRDDSTDSVFFINGSIRLIAGLGEGLVDSLGERASLGHVFELLEGPRQDLHGFAQRYRHTRGLTAFSSYLASGSHNAETVLADAQIRMTIWRDRAVSAVTAAHDLDLEALIQQPLVLVLQMREAEMERLRPVVNLFYASLLRLLMRVASECPNTRLPRPISLVIDEFATAVGRIPGFENSVNMLRSPRVSILAAVQSLAQIRQLYGEAYESVLAGFNTKIFQPNLEAIDAEYASQKAGMMSARLPEPEPLDPQRNAAGGMLPRRLFFPEEIARPPKHSVLGRPATVFMADLNPFQAWFLPAYQQPELRAFFALRPAEAALRSSPLEWNSEQRLREIHAALMGTAKSSPRSPSAPRLPGNDELIPPIPSARPPLRPQMPRLETPTSRPQPETKAKRPRKAPLDKQRDETRDASGTRDLGFDAPPPASG